MVGNLSNKITFLGTAGESLVVAKNYRIGHCLILNFGDIQFIIDPASGSLSRLADFGFDIRNTTALFLSSSDINSMSDADAMISALTIDGMDKKGVLVGPNAALSKLRPVYRKLMEKEIVCEPGGKVGIYNVDEKFSKISGLDHINVLGINEGYEKKEKTVEEKHEAKEMEKSKTIAKASTKVVKQVQTVKIDIKRLDHLLNMVGELLISKIRLQQISKKYNIKELDIILASIDRLTLDIQDEVMAERMVPIGNIFNRYPRMVRDLAGKENKKIKFEMEGSEIEFDRTILDEIGDPLVHLLRNSVDHGIEDPDVREDAGKNVFGKIKIKALREKNYAVIQVSDDGAGISPKKIRESSIKKGMLTAEEAEKMSDKQLQYLIFKPGLSTNEVVTSVSGRGVGMDVVESKIRSLGGSLTLDSTPGEGTVITMKLPLTVAIISALLVSVSKQTYAIPLSVVNMTVEIDKEDIKTIQKNKVFLLRGKEIPIVSLHEVFGFEYKDNAKKTLVIVEKSGEHVGLLIDEIIVQQQILIKSLDGLIKGVKGFGGATILGDGAVALIIDVESLI
jgi:two-component system chemotaxis sensor kinase CheA